MNKLNQDVLLQAPGQSEIFLIKEEEKHWLQNSATAAHYCGEDWIKKYKIISLAEINEYPTGGTYNIIGEPKRARDIYFPEEQPVLARVYTLKAQIMPRNKYTKIILENKSYDLGNNFNNSRLTIPVPGYYHIMGQTSWEDEYISDKDIFETRICRNGNIDDIFLSSNEASPSTGSTDINPIVNDIRHLNKDDYIEMYGAPFRKSGDGRLRANCDAGNFLTIRLIKQD